MEGYVANYINAQLLHYLASRPIEDKAPNAATAFGLESIPCTSTTGGPAGRLSGTRVMPKLAGVVTARSSRLV